MKRDDPRLAFYPFLRGEGATAAGGAALVDAAVQSAREKFADIVAARRELAVASAGPLETAAGAIAQRLRRGGRIIACGNGGSATDAADVVADCLAPPRPGWAVLPALSLPDNAAMLTAVGNDVSFEQVYARQLIALAAPADVLLVFSTSGGSPNVLAAVRQAARQGLLTVAFTGGDGTALADDPGVACGFIVTRRYIPRIQEGHATLWHALLGRIQAFLAGPGRESEPCAT